MRVGDSLLIYDCGPILGVTDGGGPRAGSAQGDVSELDGDAILVLNGKIADVGGSDRLRRYAQAEQIPAVDAGGRCVLPGLVECHSHPLFGGRRGREYNLRLGGADLQTIARAGGGISASVVATRQATDDELLRQASCALRRLLHAGVTTLEAKSGYGLSRDQEMRSLRLLSELKGSEHPELVISFLGAHVVPTEFSSSSEYTEYVISMLNDVAAEGLADFHDITLEEGYFSEADAERLAAASRQVGLPIKVHADAWATSGGWQFAVRNDAVSADHLTFTTADQVIEAGATDTVAVLLPVAELIYMTERRAPARQLIENRVPVAISTDYCSSIRSVSSTSTMTMAAPWFRMTVEEVVVGFTLNAAYAIGRGSDRGSIDIGKRGDLVVLSTEDPYDFFLELGSNSHFLTVKAGRIINA